MSNFFIEIDNPYAKRSPQEIIAVAKDEHKELDAKKQRIAMTPFDMKAIPGMVEDILGGVAVHGDPKNALTAMYNARGSREEEATLDAWIAHIVRNAGQVFFRLGVMSQDIRYFEYGAKYADYAHTIAGLTEVVEKGPKANGFVPDQEEALAVSLTEAKMMEMMAKPGSMIRGQVLRAFDDAEERVENPDAILALANWLLFDCEIGVTRAKQEQLEGTRARAQVLKWRKMSYTKETKLKVTVPEMVVANLAISMYNKARGIVVATQQQIMSAEDKLRIMEVVERVEPTIPIGKFLASVARE